MDFYAQLSVNMFWVDYRGYIFCSDLDLNTNFSYLGMEIVLVSRMSEELQWMPKRLWILLASTNLSIQEKYSCLAHRLEEQLRFD
jgi:hypothetical protein